MSLLLEPPKIECKRDSFCCMRSTEAEAQLLSCVTSILAQLDKVPPGAIRTLLEARLTKLLEQDIGGAQALPATSTPGPARNLPDDGAAGGRS